MILPTCAGRGLSERLERWKKQHKSGVEDGMLIEIWSDVVCPWCYVGKRRLESALATFEHAEEVEVRWRSFQLDPAAPRSRPDDAPGTAERLSRKYGVGIEQARAMNDRVTSLAAAEGLEFRLDHARGTNTLDAHRLLHEAAAHGLQDALKERLLRAYFTGGERIDDPEVLARVATEAGLDAETVTVVLSSDEHADAVRADQDEARALGATGVPFAVVDRRYGVSGAQPVEVFTAALERAWADRAPVTVLSGAVGAGGEACGPHGC